MICAPHTAGLYGSYQGRREEGFILVSTLLLKGQCHEIFHFRFFSWISFPQAPKYAISAVLNISKKPRDICSSRCTIGVVDTSGVKNLQSEKFKLFLFGHLWVVELTYRSIFSFKFTLRCQQSDINPIISHATGVIDTGGKFASGIADTGGKCATCINNTSSTGG